MTTKEILTVVEVAHLLKVVDKTIYTMAQRGEIPAFKVRGQWRFRRSDIDLWIDDRILKARKNNTRQRFSNTPSSTTTERQLGS